MLTGLNKLSITLTELKPNGDQYHLSIAMLWRRIAMQGESSLVRNDILEFVALILKSIGTFFFFG